MITYLQELFQLSKRHLPSPFTLFLKIGKTFLKGEGQGEDRNRDFYYICHIESFGRAERCFVRL